MVLTGAMTKLQSRPDRGSTPYLRLAGGWRGLLRSRRLTACLRMLRLLLRLLLQLRLLSRRRLLRLLRLLLLLLRQLWPRRRTDAGRQRPGEAARGHWRRRAGWGRQARRQRA